MSPSAADAPTANPASAFPLLRECAADEVTRLVTDHLDIFDRLSCACACKAFLLDWSDRVSDGALRLSGPGAARVSDRFLLWLLRRVPTVRSLEVSECALLSRAGVRRAIQFGNTEEMTELRALSVGGVAKCAPRCEDYITRDVRRNAPSPKPKRQKHAYGARPWTANLRTTGQLLSTELLVTAC